MLLRSIWEQVWTMPAARAGIVFFVGLIIGATLLLALGLVYQVSQLNPLGLWSVALVIGLAAGAAAIVWRRQPISRRVVGPLVDQPRAEGTHTADPASSPAVETATKVVLIDEEPPWLRRSQPSPDGDDVVSLKRRFDEALRTDDLAEAGRYLDAVERYGAEADWVAVKRDLLRDRQARR